ncbi:MAG: ferrous iron transport protein A [Cyanobacteria bacterium SBLK]|nr:ferrous iron transport protein A [Cyanobacteria bacterium SBLK]
MNGHHHRQAKNRRQRNQKQPDWGFTFLGGTGNADVSEASSSIPEAAFPLSEAGCGSQVWIVGYRGREGLDRLLEMGLIPGVQLQIISNQPSGSVIVAIDNNCMGLGAGMAQTIMVSDRPIEIDPREETRSPQTTDATETILSLREMTPGSTGRVLGYEKAYQGYRGKLLSMGLAPGTEFTVLRVAPLGYSVEINAGGLYLSLRKQEADALIVEEVTNGWN